MLHVIKRSLVDICNRVTDFDMLSMVQTSVEVTGWYGMMVVLPGGDSAVC